MQGVGRNGAKNVPRSGKEYGSWKPVLARRFPDEVNAPSPNLLPLTLALSRSLISSLLLYPSLARPLSRSDKAITSAH